MSTARSPRLQTEFFSQDHDKENDLYSIHVKRGDRTSHSSFGGIEVTTEMTVMQETPKHEDSSERRLVMESA